MRAKTRRNVTIVGLLLAAAPTIAEAAGESAGVSPGDRVRFAGVENRCPSFSWTVVEGALKYELRVYAAEESRPAVADEPVLRVALPAGATGWTPPAEDCLKRGRHYAWSLRAITEKGDSAWSEPLLFQIAGRSSDEELAQALEVVRRHFDVAGTTGRQDARPPDQDDGQASTAVSVESPTPQPAAAPIPAGDPAAQIRVVGEVRTVAPDGTARLWGRGRTTEVYGTFSPLVGDVPCVTGSIKHGLSTTAVDWGSAADACPVGNWVCRLSGEFIPCNTTRPDSDIDAFDACTNSTINRAQDEHLGWVAEPHLFINDYNGLTRSENNLSSSRPKCWMLPVWCCWE